MVYNKTQRLQFSGLKSALDRRQAGIIDTITESKGQEHGWGRMRYIGVATWSTTAQEVAVKDEIPLCLIAAPLEGGVGTFEG